MDDLVKNIRTLCEKYETETNDFVELSLTQFEENKQKTKKIISFEEKNIKICIDLSNIDEHMEKQLIPKEIDVEWLILNINEIYRLSGNYSSEIDFNVIIINKTRFDNYWSRVSLNYSNCTVVVWAENVPNEWTIGYKIGDFAFTNNK